MDTSKDKSSNLWYWKLEDSQPLSANELKFLGPKEREYWESPLSPARKRQFMAGRILVKSVLIEYFGFSMSMMAQDLPRFLVSLDEMQMAFSLSHSKKVVLAGFVPVFGDSEGENAGVGVDLEIVVSVEKNDLDKELERLSRIVRRFFAESEIGEWKELSDLDKIDYFYRHWTLKEAVFKFQSQLAALGQEVAPNFYRVLKKPVEEYQAKIQTRQGKFKERQGKLTTKVYWAWVMDNSLIRRRQVSELSGIPRIFDFFYSQSS